MRPATLLLLTCALAAGGCGPSRVNVLEHELSAYKLQGEELRRNDLEEAYRKERDRSEELVAKITAARQEYARLAEVRATQDAELQKLRAQVASLRKELADLAAERARLEKEKSGGE
jgi:uncharacterized protein HemX